MTGSAALGIALAPLAAIILRLVVRALAVLLTPLVPRRWRSTLYRRR